MPAHAEPRHSRQGRRPKTLGKRTRGEQLWGSNCQARGLFRFEI